MSPYYITTSALIHTYSVNTAGAVLTDLGI